MAALIAPSFMLMASPSVDELNQASGLARLVRGVAPVQLGLGLLQKAERLEDGRTLFSFQSGDQIVARVTETIPYLYDQVQFIPAKVRNADQTPWANPTPSEMDRLLGSFELSAKNLYIRMSQVNPGSIVREESSCIPQTVTVARQAVRAVKCQLVFTDDRSDNRVLSVVLAIANSNRSRIAYLLAASSAAR